MPGHTLCPGMVRKSEIFEKSRKLIPGQEHRRFLRQNPLHETANWSSQGAGFIAEMIEFRKNR